MPLVADDQMDQNFLQLRITWAISHARKTGDGFALLLIRPGYCTPAYARNGVVVHPGLLHQIIDYMLPRVRRIDSVVPVDRQCIALLAEEVRGSGDALSLARRLHALLDGPIFMAGAYPVIDSDMGIVLYPLHGSTTQDLIDHAHLALAQTRQPGGTDMELYRRGGGKLNDAEEE